MSIEIYPYIFGRKIGTILYDEGNVYFEYDEKFKASGLEISPLKLPLSSTGLYTNRDDTYFDGLAGVFHDSLPDKFGTKVIERYYESKGIPAQELNILQKLMFVGNKAMGAISYLPAEHTFDDTETIEALEISQFYESAKKIMEGKSISVISEMLSFMDSAASAGGARAKAVVGFSPETDKMVYGLNDNLPEGFGHWLIKFDSLKDDGSSSDFTKLEYIYMSMAREAGINVPNIRMIKQEKLSHYLIERFDRVDGRRVHLHSAAGMTHTNFNIPKHYSYDELMRLTRYITGEQQAVEEQFRRMIFNIVARNQDDHAKNFSYMMDNNGVWKISPAYDITYANGQGYTKNHQLSLKGKVNDFTIEDILSLAKEHSIDEKWTRECVQNIVEIVSTFPIRAKEIGIHRDFASLVSNDHRSDIIKI